MIDADFVAKLQELDEKGKDGVPEMREILRGNMGRLIALAAAGLERSPRSKAKIARGSRWLPDQEVPQEWLDSASARRAKIGLPAIDLRAAAEEFVTYWPSVPGPRGMKLDWKGTFENCALRARPISSPYLKFGVVDGVTFENTDLRGWTERLRVHAGHYEGGEGGSPAGSWSPKWGPAPGHPASKVPPEASAEFARRFPPKAEKTAL